MGSLVLAGAPASPGSALGAARVLDARPANGDSVQIPPERRADELRRALEALEEAADDVLAVAARLRRDGRAAEAEVVETGALLGEDPELRDGVEHAVVEEGLVAAAAILAATSEGAAAIAALPDPVLAGRSDDVMSLGRRAARIADGRKPASAGSDRDDVIVVASELGPADVAELAAEVRGIALAAGGVTAHAAIVARSLGIPMVVGLGDELLRFREGELLVVDGSEGVAVTDPEPEVVERARAATNARNLARQRALASSDLPSVTTDGHGVAVLVNAAGATEVVTGLEAGADGVGLLRTELAFLEAGHWPSEEEHRAALEPILASVGTRSVTVRVLDFGGDKTPPFLAGERRRGIELLRSAPEALEAQLRAIFAVRGEARLRVLVPMVRSADDLRFVRELLPGSEAPALGAMIETREGAASAGAIARESDFLSLGTNDLACDALHVERLSAAKGLAHHPKVLNLAASAVWAARRAEIPIEVCGEAASDSFTVPVFVGLGVDELSVGAARVGVVRSWVRAIAARRAREVARRALEATSTEHVEAAVRPLARELELLEAGDAAGQALEGGPRVRALGPQS